MAIALVKSAKGSSALATTTASFASATTAGNLIVLGFAADDYNGTPGAGWTQSTGMEQQTFHGGYIWWRISTGETNFQYVIGSATNSSWVIAEFSGVDASPYDVSNGQFVQSGGASAYTTPSITPSTGNRLLVAFMGASNNSNLSAQSWGTWVNSFTAIDSIGSGGSGTNDLAGLAYRLVTGNGSTGYSGGATASQTTQSRSGLIISFKEAAGGTPSGTLAVTEVADTAALAGNTGPQGTLSSTEGADTAALAAKTGPSGTLAATDTTDTAALSGSLFIGGSLATTEAADAASISGGVSYTGTLSVTDVADVAAISGNTGAVGTLAATETTDTAAFTSTSNVSGSLSVTDSPDVASLSGNAGSAGALSATETTDVAALSGVGGVTGALAATEAQDAASISGNSGVSGSLSSTEAPDISSLSGNFDVSGTLAATGSQDIAAFSYSGSITGALSATEAADIASFICAPTFKTNPLERLKMYTGSMGSVSNREDWIVDISLVGDDGTSFDLTGSEVVAYVCKRGCPNSPVLSASIGEGIVLTDDYTMQWHFSEEQMASLCPQQYDVFCRVERDDITTQLLAANIAIVEGGPA